MAVKIIIKSTEQNNEFLLGEEEFTIGRSSKSSYKINDSKASSVHCAFKLVNGRATIKDLGSSNGTYVDDLAITETFFFVGQKAKVGSTEIILNHNAMDAHELDLHTKEARDKDKKDMVVDIEKGLREKTQMVHQILKKTSASDPILNRKNSENLEVEKTTHTKKVEKIKAKYGNRSFFKIKYEHRKKSLWDMILDLFRKPK